MQLIVKDRAEQALRHLRSTDAQKVASAIERLATEGVKDMLGAGKIQALATPEGQLYIVRASPQLRIFVSYNSEDNSQLVIEDVVSRALLEKHFSDRNDG